MSDAPNITDVLRRTPVLVGIVVTLVVVLIWLFAFFLPQGSKISKLNAQVQTLQQKVTQGNAKIAVLKKDSQTEPKLAAQLAKLKQYVPATPGVYNYITTITATVKASGAKLTTISPSPEAPAPSAGAFYDIPVQLSVTGTYDQILKLVTEIYSLPRLTVIPTMQISGGGVGTNRSTNLVASMHLETFTTYKPAGPAS
ncbi:MAG: type IV pilus inner membrane component PilO [Acidimicrobiales bacterium]